MLWKTKKQVETFERAVEKLKNEIEDLSRQLSAGNVGAATEIARKRLEVAEIEKMLPELRDKIAALERSYRQRLNELRGEYAEATKNLPQLLNDVASTLSQASAKINNLFKQNDHAIDLWRQLSSTASELDERQIREPSHFIDLPFLRQIQQQTQSFQEWFSKTWGGEKK
ncbi:MAG: hypothetical protein QXF95_08030 [Candidatus Caldarchaeum sp.]